MTGQVSPGTEDMLQRLADLMSELASHVRESEQHSAAARQLTEQMQSLVNQITGSAARVPSLGSYVVIENGQSRQVTEEHLRALRRHWDGEFLLDEPSRELKVKTEEVQKTIRLGSGGLHYGLEKVLLKGMGKPGQPFGHFTFEDTLIGGAGISAPQFLSRYVYDIRKAIGDSARPSRYLHTVEVDTTVSMTSRGYAFDPKWRYLVMRRHPQKSR